MNLEQLRALLEAARTTLHERRESMEAAERAISEAPDDADEAVVSQLRTTFDEAAEAFDEAGEEAERCRRNVEDAERRERILEQHPLPEPRRDNIRVVAEELTYRESGPNSFFSDAFLARNGNQAAAERIARHEREMGEAETRDVGTGAFAGLTIPQFLIDEFAPIARAGRPFANSVRGLPLPDSGMTLSISKITTGTAVAVQATENAGVQETDIDDTKLDVSVVTIAGMQDVSRQALERSEMVDSVVFADLVEAYHTKLDSSILNDDGTSGTHKGIRSASGIISVSYTDASPTVPEAFPKLADAIQQINANRFLPATAIFMHPRRWGWFTAAVDTQNRPLVVPVAPMNPVGVGQAAEYGQVVGQILGLPVITDANIPTNLGAGTNEDVIILCRAQDPMLWEQGDGMPRQLRFEETLAGNLTVKLVVYGYSAFTAERYPKAAAVVSGTGLVTPTF